jgi:hypothetical protein
MGLLIQTASTTPEGFPVTSVYCKLTSFTYEITSTGYTLLLKIATYLTREAGHAGYRPVTIPNFCDLLAIPGAELSSFEYIYTLLKLKLEASGYTVENVLEDGQSLLLSDVTLPVLPPPPPSNVPESEAGKWPPVSSTEGEVSQQSS